MEWTDQGIVIGVRKHGESGVILDLLTREHGRHLGFVQGGRSRRMQPALQRGNSLDAVWRSRVEEQMGSYVVEPRVSRAARVMDSALALHAVNHLCTLTRLLPERDPHVDLHDQLAVILDAVEDRAVTPALVVRYELSLLTELGFGLDLDRCAATGRRDDLVYVSPKSGRAVSRGAGLPYHNRMLPLPAFLRDEEAPFAAADIVAGFRLVEHFLVRDVLGPRGLSFAEGRALYAQAVAVQNAPSS